MDLTIALLHISAWLLLAFSLAAPRLRRVTISALAVVAGLTLVSGTGDGERSLETVHTYAGYEGNSMEVSMVSFPTGTVTAPAGQWAIPYAGFALLWILILWALRRREVKNPWLLPLLLAWTSFAAWLGMQYLAAPAVVVQPVGLDRFLWPAGLALSLVAAKNARGLVMLFVMVSSGILLGRLPVALFSKYASDERLGSILDIHLVRDIVNPMTQQPFQPRLEVDSGDQQFWLIWLEHVIFFPGVYAMSLLGIAFGAYMFHKHAPAAPQTARAAG
ncbi:MAG: hypothetical protein ACON4Z_00740 [Planctomycetota bacterium]